MTKNVKGPKVRAADLIREGLEEAVAFVRGADTGARVVRGTLTARHVSGQTPPAFDSARIIDLRSRMQLSQTVFADALNVSPETVRAWEQGKNTPGGPALRLLEIVNEHPEVALARIHVNRTIDDAGNYRRPLRKVGMVTSDAGGKPRQPAAKKMSSPGKAVRVAAKKR